MTEQQVINKFDKWCNKRHYAVCRLNNHNCRYCADEFYAKWIVRLQKKLDKIFEGK